MIWKDTTAAEFIPIRLLISITVIAVITFLVFTGFTSIQSTGELESFRNELKMMRSEIALLYATGEQRELEDPFASSGTKRIFTVHIPRSVIRLSFGSYGPSYELTVTDESASSGIFFTMQDGSQEVVWCDDSVDFRAGISVDDRFVTDGSRPCFSFRKDCEMNVTFELVSQNDQKFILIY